MNDDILTQTLPADIIAASGHVGYRWDLEKDRLIWFGPWRQLFGDECAEPPMNAMELSTRVLPNDHHVIFNDPSPSFDREYRLRGEDGSLVWVHEHGTTDYETGRAVRQQGLIRLVKSETKNDAPIYVSPDRDYLTGRPNRACLQSTIEKILKGPREARAQSGYMVVGIDRLAFVNEAMGAKAADSLICAVADRLNEICPTRAIVGRVSGDIFGIVLPSLEREREGLAERILVNFHDHAISAGEACLHLSVCVGSVPFADTHGDAGELMIHAEQALHEARDGGRGRHVAYIESARRAQAGRMVLEIGECVKQSLKDDTLHLAFQPIVDARSGGVEFYEVLSRLFFKNGEAIPAGEFIPIVEQMGLAPEFDKHVLTRSVQELAGSDALRLSVNVSGLTAALPDWPAFVQTLLAGRPDVARRLIIEITETAAVVDIAKMKCLVESLRGMGSQVALDDFGAGATSIRHLRDLDFGIMKIDRDLLINLETNSEQQHLVRMLIAMAHGLGLNVIAEGIEAKSVADWLRREGVDMFQGFYFGKPSFDKPWLKIAPPPKEGGFRAARRIVLI